MSQKASHLSTIECFSFSMLLFCCFFPTRCALECCENPIRWTNSVRKPIHDNNHMNSSYGIFDAPLSLLTKCRHKDSSNCIVIGKQISIQNTSPLSFMATHLNNGYFCNLCCVIQKLKANEMCLLACVENDFFCGQSMLQGLNCFPIDTQANST